MKYRILKVIHDDNSIEYEIQGRILFLWCTLSYYKGICTYQHVYKTKQEAEDTIKKIKQTESKNKVKSTKVIHYD